MEFSYRFILEFVLWIWMWLNVVEDKRSLADIDQLPNISFRFFYQVGPAFIYRTRVQSLFALVTDPLSNWLTHWLTPVLVNLIDVTLVCEDGNLRLIEVLLLLKLMMRSMPTTVWYKFGRSTLVIKLSYCSVCLRFRSWCSGKILKLLLGREYEDEIW